MQALKERLHRRSSKHPFVSYKSLEWQATSNTGEKQMSNPDVLEFGRVLVTEVRDNAISACDTMMSPHAKGPTAARWRKAAETGPEVLARTIIADCVDETIFQLLRAIDNEELAVHFLASSGRLVNLPETGLSELAGWFIGPEGWRQMFSQERILR